MTREEAIKILRREIECLSHTKCEDCILQVACDPIKTTPYDSEYIEVYEMAIKALEQEPCEDAVSRQAVLECFTWTNDKADVWNRIKELSSVTPQPKTGHWIEKDGFDGDTYYDCSVCGESWTTIEGTPWDNEFKYCPNCGCRMVEPQERSGEE